MIKYEKVREKPILVMTEAEKRARKAKQTKNANLRLKQAESAKLVRKDKALAKVRAELKAIKDLVSSGRRPGN